MKNYEKLENFNQGNKVEVLSRVEQIIMITDEEKKKRREKIMELISCRRDFFIQKKDGIQNIVVPQEFRQSKKITFMAHYDVYPGSLGYNDNSSGVVALLNIMDKLPEIEFVFSDGEEIGGLGAELYAQTLFPDIVIAVDVVGVGDAIYYENTRGIDVKKLSPKDWHKNIFEIPDAIFHDAKIIAKYGVRSALIMSEYREKREHAIEDVFKYQHANVLDNRIEFISEEQIILVEEFLVSLGKNLVKESFKK